MYDQAFKKIVVDKTVNYSDNVPAVIDNVTMEVAAPVQVDGQYKAVGDLNEIIQALLNNDGSLKILIDNLRKVQISAGTGLTGGGTIDSNRTINIVSANDGIRVNEDSIELMTVNSVDSDSTTKPASGASVKKAYNKGVTALEAAQKAQKTADQKLDKGDYIGDASDLDHDIKTHKHKKSDIIGLYGGDWMKKVCLYYGYPTAINGTWDIDAAVAIYKKFDVVVFGDEYNEPVHEENGNLKQIISKLRAQKPEIEIFGYVPCAVSGGTKNYDTATVKQKIDLYFQCGDIDGIFCDEWGFDYKNTRERQNEIINYVRAKRKDIRGNNIGKVFVNSWEDTYTFSNEDIVIDWLDNFRGNPNQIPAILNENDYSLYENLFWQINERGVQQHQEAWPIFKAWVYYNEVAPEFGMSFYQKYKTKTIALDAIKEDIYKNNKPLATEMKTISLALSRMLNVTGVALGSDDWSASNCYIEDYTIPDIHSFTRGTSPDPVEYKMSGGNSGFPNYYKVKLGEVTWEAYWTDNGTSMSKGRREVLKNGVKITNLWETDLEAAMKTVVHRSSDTLKTGSIDFNTFKDTNNRVVLKPTSDVTFVGAPEAFDNGVVLSLGNGTDTENPAAQIAIKKNTLGGHIYIRTLDAATKIWSDWSELYHPGKKPTPEDIGALNNQYCPYKVGDIYQTTRTENPATLWPGTTWQKIEGKYLKGTAGTGGSKATGGSMTKKLTLENIPAHNHSASGSTGSAGNHAHTANHNHSASQAAHNHNANHGHSAYQYAHSHTQPAHTHRVMELSFNNHAYSEGGGGTFGSGGYLTTTAAGGETTGSSQPGVVVNNTNFNTGNAQPGVTVNTANVTTSQNGSHSHSVSVSIGNAGGGKEFNIEPAYFTVHMWLRTA